MLPRTTVILPAATPNWEVWTCASGRASEWKGTEADPSQGLNGRPVIAALPARACRTFAFSAPTQDRQLVRQLAYAQLEKRGLAAASSAQTAFDCHVHGQTDGRSLVSVDVVLAEDTAAAVTAKARGLLPAARLFTLPEHTLVLIEEQGRLVLCAGVGGRLVHSQIVSTSRELGDHTAAEVRIAALALPQQGVLAEVTGVELWGDFSAEEAAAFGGRLGLPVKTLARPAPEPKAVEREASTRLLPPAARLAVRRRRLQALKWLAGAAVLLLALGGIWSKHRQLVRLEKKAVELEAAVNAPRGDDAGSSNGANRQVRATQQRWNELSLALEPRRYPLGHLNALARCQSAGDVVMRRFESKVSHVTMLGTARSAGDAYAYFNAVRADRELSLYGWSMVQPRLEGDGTAHFEITGKLR